MLNVSKGTRALEVCGFVGSSEQTYRSFGVNLSGVVSNSIKLAQTGWGFPKLDDLLVDFINQ